MFNLGLSEIILISIIALIFIGPKQLPEIARAIGRALNELKRASEDLTGSITNPRHYSQTEELPKKQSDVETLPQQPTSDSTSVAEESQPSSTGSSSKGGAST